MPASLARALQAHVDSVFFGPNGDYAAVMEALQGVTAEEALWKPSPSQNSIWQIVEHLIGSNAWLTEMIKGGDPAAPQWTEPSGDEAAWQAALGRLNESHQRLKAALATLGEPELMKMPIPGLESTMLELILSSGPAHEAHHGGQIDYLKGLQRSPSVASKAES